MKYPRFLLLVDGDPAGQHTVTIIQGERRQVLAVDGWRLRKGWYWPDAHNEVVRRVLKLAHRGTARPSRK